MKTVLIIGGGVAGYSLAIELCKSFRVKIFENKLIGGTCVNTGCIPTKFFTSKRDLISSVKTSSLFNIPEQGIVDLKKLKTEKDEKIKKIRDSVISGLKKGGVEIIDGEAKLSGTKVIVDSVSFDGDIIVIASGSIPANNTEIEADNKKIVSKSSDEFFNLEEFPEHLAIIGAGYIGLEFATVYNEFGSKVTIFEKSNSVLNDFEASTIKSLEARLKQQGIEIIKNALVKKINFDGTIEFELNSKHSISNIFSHILFSTGRKPNIPEGLNADLSEKGFVKVNEKFKTSIENIYAIGDVIGTPFFAHRAGHQAYLLSRIIKGETVKSENLSLIPHVVFTHPEIAKIGFTEEELKINNTDFEVYKIPYGVLGKSVILDETGQIKLIIDKRRIILGCVVIGKYASELIGLISALMSKGITIDEMKEITFPHPTFCEIFGEIVRRCC